MPPHDPSHVTSGPPNTVSAEDQAGSRLLRRYIARVAEVMENPWTAPGAASGGGKHFSIFVSRDGQEHHRYLRLMRPFSDMSMPRADQTSIADEAQFICNSMHASWAVDFSFSVLRLQTCMEPEGMVGPTPSLESEEMTDAIYEAWRRARSTIGQRQGLDRLACIVSMRWKEHETGGSPMFGADIVVTSSVNAAEIGADHPELVAVLKSRMQTYDCDNHILVAIKRSPCSDLSDDLNNAWVGTMPIVKPTIEPLE